VVLSQFPSHLMQGFPGRRVSASHLSGPKGAYDISMNDCHSAHLSSNFILMQIGPFSLPSPVCPFNSTVCGGFQSFHTIFSIGHILGFPGFRRIWFADDFITEEAERVHFGWVVGNFPGRKMADYSVFSAIASEPPVR
jgi:hypothetical protein